MDVTAVKDAAALSTAQRLKEEGPVTQTKARRALDQEPQIAQGSPRKKRPEGVKAKVENGSAKEQVSLVLKAVPMKSHELPKGKPISSAKVAANRLNAQRSTGPKSKEGKKWSRRNAIKHGILSSVLLVNGREEEAALQELLASLRLEYQPLGPSEALLVEEIANCWWRLRQAHRFEADLIRRSAERSYLTDQGDATPEEAIHLFRQAVEEAQRRACDGVEDIGSALRRISSLSTQDFSAALTLVRAKRYLELGAEQDLRDLAENLGLKAAFDAAMASQHSDAPQWTSLIPLDTRLMLPADKDLSLVLRYRHSIHRELAEDMDRLERMQRSRKGEHVPVPLRVNLSTGK
jgi:hypothetical protein